MNRGVKGLYKGTYAVALICFVIVSLLSGNPTLAADAASLTRAKGAKLSDISLPIPKALEEKNYLGLSCEGLDLHPH